MLQCTKNDPTETLPMTPFVATEVMDRIGMTFINAALLAGLPAAVIAILLQAV